MFRALSFALWLVCALVVSAVAWASATIIGYADCSPEYQATAEYLRFCGEEPGLISDDRVTVVLGTMFCLIAVLPVVLAVRGRLDVVVALCLQLAAGKVAFELAGIPRGVYQESGPFDPASFDVPGTIAVLGTAALVGWLAARRGSRR